MDGREEETGFAHIWTDGHTIYYKYGKGDMKYVLYVQK